MLLSTSAVAKLTSATVRMLDHWANTGLLRPSGQDAAGKGSKRRYTFQDIVVVQAVRNLRKGGCPLQTIRRVIRYLLAHYPDQPSSAALARLTLLTDGTKVYMLTDGQQVVDVVSRQFQIGWVVPLGKLIRETHERFDLLPQKWTERVIVSGKAFRFDVSRAIPTRTNEAALYIARCRELPGALREALTPEQVVAELKQAVATVVAHDAAERPKRRAAVRRRAV
jgi:DNA-binding transcriptional MerR regulator